MDFHSGLKDRTYGLGELHQRCDACGWWQRGHRCELVQCPACAAALPVPWAIEFGGLLVERRKGGFMLHDSQERCLVLCEADVPDSLRFMATHWSQGMFGKLGEPGFVQSGMGSHTDVLKGRYRFLGY